MGEWGKNGGNSRGQKKKVGGQSWCAQRERKMVKGRKRGRPIGGGHGAGTLFFYVEHKRSQNEGQNGMMRGRGWGATLAIVGGKTLFNDRLPWEKGVVRQYQQRGAGKVGGGGKREDPQDVIVYH